MFQIVDDSVTKEKNNAVIKVIGVGGGGGNALEYMIKNHIANVDFVCINTDAQALEASSADSKLRLGGSLTNGLGAGCNPEVGREAAIEDRDKLQEMLAGTDMVFIAAGMGGGTGTGAAPIIAEIARANGSLTVAVVTKPFALEGERRADVAQAGINELKRNVDSLITIPNEKLLTVLGEDTTLLEAFAEADKVLYGAVQGIAELITCRGLINLDFADVKTVMSGTGMAMIGTGRASGEQRAYEAAHAAINNPLLDDVHLANANGMLVNITGGKNVKMPEFQEIGICMKELASKDATVAIGTVVDPSIEDEIRVTLIATGFGEIDDAGIAPPITHPAAPEDLPQTDDVKPIGDDEYDVPTIYRNPQPSDNSADEKESNTDKEYQEILDIPAFLRQQVD